MVRKNFFFQNVRADAFKWPAFCHIMVATPMRLCMIQRETEASFMSCISIMNAERRPHLKHAQTRNACKLPLNFKVHINMNYPLLLK